MFRLRAHPDEASLLAAHGLAGAVESPFEHSGFSGATLSRLTRDDGTTVILKRTSMSRDWIMRATDDAECREYAIDDGALPPGVRSPLAGYSREDDGCTMLMHDISAQLLPQGPIDEERLDIVMRGMAALHTTAPPNDVPWCDMRARLLLLSPTGAQIAASYGAPVANDLIEGWRLFARLATPGSIRLIEALHADPSPLLSALERIPTKFLHGDLKFDNIGIDGEGRLWLIDWAMTMQAPAAVELGWFLAINSRRLPCSLDDAMALYARHAGLAGNVREMHEGLSVICGLVLRGWRKALDADAGEPAELTWWCERTEAAERFLP
jgi:hypothetical protein